MSNFKPIQPGVQLLVHNIFHPGMTIKNMLELCKYFHEQSTKMKSSINSLFIISLSNQASRDKSTTTTCLRQTG